MSLSKSSQIKNFGGRLSRDLSWTLIAYVHLLRGRRGGMKDEDSNNITPPNLPLT